MGGETDHYLPHDTNSLSLHSQHHYTVTPFTTPPHSQPTHNTTSQSTHSQHHYTFTSLTTPLHSHPIYNTTSQSPYSRHHLTVTPITTPLHSRLLHDTNVHSCLSSSLSSSPPINSSDISFSSLKKGGMGEEVRSHRVEGKEREHFTLIS
ncbi:hypothetical protein Pmani_032354 [Petrolisthes manimaculis]|uniref:Uncharacterized protein n=1 Tax=Petrolisthes manimaculis TaxID=1843537 RepID=A0AAE1NSR7_9EUCA|nr:hypothetical protein Pmani_032354 [Petrolisthes manimaculis]